MSDMDKYREAATNRCANVKQQFPDSWKGELLVRKNKLIKRNYQGKPQKAYDQAEIELILNLLEWKSTNNK